jgi:hypothetical protein
MHVHDRLERDEEGDRNDEQRQPARDFEHQNIPRKSRQAIAIPGWNKV